MNELPREVYDAIDNFMAKIIAFESRREQAHTAGLPALKRLLTVAGNDTGQAITCRRVLLGLYNGHAHPFPLTELRGLDSDLFDDCMAVIAMDASGPIKEIHEYVKDGGIIFENWAKGMKND